jgi:FkbM family methyltransferase
MVRLFSVENKQVIHQWNKNKLYWILEDDDVISNNIVWTGYWEKWLTDRAIPRIKPNTNVIDIGANIGTWTIPMSKIATNVYAFEPATHIYQQLNANLFINQCYNVETYKVALSNINYKDVYMKTPDPSNLGMTRIVDEKTNIVAKTRTLDSYNLTNISLIKIDVEGHEYDVFEGARETIIREKPIVYFETWNHIPEFRDKVIHLLNSWDMKVDHIWENDFVAYFNNF